MSSFFWDITQCSFEVTDFSGQPTGPIFRGLAEQEGLSEPWRWDRKVVPKRQYPTTNLRCVTSQKSEDISGGLFYNSLKSSNLSKLVQNNGHFACIATHVSLNLVL